MSTLPKVACNWTACGLSSGANNFLGAKVCYHLGLDTDSLQGWLCDKNRCRCVSSGFRRSSYPRTRRGTRKAVSCASREAPQADRERGNFWLWFGPVSDSTCIYPEEALSWKRIICIKPWTESIHARQSPVREWRDGCCGYNGTTLKLCTRVGRKTLLMHFRAPIS